MTTQASEPKIENPPAFPVPSVCNANGDVQYGTDGMTLRDYFAAKATDSDIGQYLSEGWCREGAKFAYADTMLKARVAK